MSTIPIYASRRSFSALHLARNYAIIEQLIHLLRVSILFILKNIYFVISTFYFTLICPTETFLTQFHFMLVMSTAAEISRLELHDQCQPIIAVRKKYEPPCLGLYYRETLCRDHLGFNNRIFIINKSIEHCRK